MALQTSRGSWEAWVPREPCRPPRGFVEEPSPVSVEARIKLSFGGAVGRPKGSKNKLTLLREDELRKVMDRCQVYLAKEVPAILRAVVNKAKEGDMQAAKLVLDRFIATKKSVEHTGEVRHVQVTISGVTIQGEYEDAEAAERRALPASGRPPANGSGSTHEPAPADSTEW